MHYRVDSTVRCSPHKKTTFTYSLHFAVEEAGVSAELLEGRALSSTVQGCPSETVSILWTLMLAGFNSCIARRGVVYFQYGIASSG